MCGDKIQKTKVETLIEPFKSMTFSRYGIYFEVRKDLPISWH